MTSYHGPAEALLPHMRILFLVSAHNSLSQRAQLALTELGHAISVAVVSSGLEMEAADRKARSTGSVGSSEPLIE